MLGLIYTLLDEFLPLESWVECDFLAGCESRTPWERLRFLAARSSRHSVGGPVSLFLLEISQIYTLLLKDVKIGCDL